MASKKSSGSSSSADLDLSGGTVSSAETELAHGEKGSASVTYSPALSVPLALAGGLDHPNFNRSDFNVIGGGAKLLGLSLQGDSTFTTDNSFALTLGGGLFATGELTIDIPVFQPWDISVSTDGYFEFGLGANIVALGSGAGAGAGAEASLKVDEGQAGVGGSVDLGVIGLKGSAAVELEPYLPPRNFIIMEFTTNPETGDIVWEKVTNTADSNFTNDGASAGYYGPYPNSDLTIYVDGQNVFNTGYATPYRKIEDPLEALKQQIASPDTTVTGDGFAARPQDSLVERSEEARQAAAAAAQDEFSQVGKQLTEEAKADLAAQWGAMQGGAGSGNSLGGGASGDWPEGGSGASSGGGASGSSYGGGSSMPRGAERAEQQHSYSDDSYGSWGDGLAIPLAIDLDGDGLETIAFADSSARYDLDQDGFLEKTSCALASNSTKRYNTYNVQMYTNAD